MRMGVLVVVALLIILVGLIPRPVAANQASEANLISNGSFESVDERGLPTGFGTWIASGKPVVAVDESRSRTGVRSVRITADESARASLNRTLPMQGGGAYQVTVWIQTSDTLLDTNVVLRLMAYKTEGSSESDKVPWRLEWLLDPNESWYEVSGNNFHIRPLQSPAEDYWRPLTATFLLPENVIRLDIQLFNWHGTGTVWFDDLVFKPVDPSLFASRPTSRDGLQDRTGRALDDTEPLLGTLRAGHPRLLATQEDFARIRQLVTADPIAKSWHANLVSTANSLLSAPVSFYHIPDGLRLLATSQQVLDRVQKLAMAYRLTDDSRYAERAWEELKAAAEFPDWNPRHFLDTAEMTHAFAIGYDWLFDFLSNERRATLRQAMIEKGLEPGVQAYRGMAPGWGSWVNATHNWNLVCNGGLAMGALALADEVPELAEEILRGAIQSAPRALVRFAPDGGWDEGVGYWHYSIRYTVPLLAALETALGDDFGLGDIPGLDQAGTFPIYMTGPTGSTFNFADSGSGAVRAPELFWLAQRYDRPEYAWWQAQAVGTRGGPLDLLWYRPGGSQRFGEGTLPLDRYFRGVEVFAARSDWRDPNSVYLGFKAGDNRANHSNLDLGTFVVDALGERWAVDLGPDDYNLPGYFSGAQRWSYYRMRAEGQNTLVLDSGTGPGQNPSAAARIVAQVARPDEAFAIADLTQAYLGRAVKVQRGVALLDGRRQVLIQDEVLTRQPSDLWWFMHTQAEVHVIAEGQAAVLQRNGKQMWARILSPSDARFIVMPAQPLPDSPNPAGQNLNAGVRKLAIHLGDVSDVRVAVQLVPLPDGEAAVSMPPVVPLAEWRQEGPDSTVWPAPGAPVVRVEGLRGGATLQGDVPLRVQLVGPSGLGHPGTLEVSSTRVHFGGHVIYDGPGLPADLHVNTRDTADGAQLLTVTVQRQSGEVLEAVYQVEVSNWWRLDDPFEPPLESTWFGTVDRSQTSSESTGWAYATDRYREFFGDSGRRVRERDTTEFLVWETPLLRSFKLRLYTTSAEDVRDILRLHVSDDGVQWREVAYDLKVVAQNEAGLVHVEVSGQVSPDWWLPKWFRLTLRGGASTSETESETAAQALQLGALELHGLKE